MEGGSEVVFAAKPQIKAKSIQIKSIALLYLSCFTERKNSRVFVTNAGINFDIY